jgi:hypothetical protein
MGRLSRENCEDNHETGCEIMKQAAKKVRERPVLLESHLHQYMANAT